MSDITITRSAQRRPMLVDVPEATFLALDGSGAPSGPAFEAAVHTIVGAGMRAGATGPVEGLWWSGEETELDFDDPAGWSWTLLMAVPDDTPEPAEGPVALRRIAEGPSAQILHIGPHADEAPTIAELLAWISDQGYAKNGPHHELYLDDPRTTAPERLRTVIRQPVGAA
jgi:hypothetical protein